MEVSRIQATPAFHNHQPEQKPKSSTPSPACPALAGQPATALSNTPLKNPAQVPYREISSGTKKREIIDVIVDGVKNPRDVNDCVAVPRGIFKAYIALMAGTALMAMSNFLPKKVKPTVNIIGWGLNILSAYYFAKPFAIKGLSPTVTKEEVESNNTK